MQEDSSKPPPNALDDFIALVESSIERRSLTKLVLAKNRLASSDLVRASARPIEIKGKECLSFVYTHKTRDITKNFSAADSVRQVRALLGGTLCHAHLSTDAEDIQLMISKKGRQTLLRSPIASKGAAVGAPPDVVAAAAHDREKHRFLDLDRAFLGELGITKPEGKPALPKLVPAMARKWKQINKFIEVFDHALETSQLKAARAGSDSAIEVADFGSGKGYLTFAMHDYLRHSLGLPAEVTGVELRADMVSLCNDAAQRLGLEGLHFEQGDVSSVAPKTIDIMIALHACDTATDHAIHTGLRAGASIIMCSPCCHKELRPQLLSPHPLRPILKHGVHLGQEAEMLTDGLRAMLLDACGYDTRVFEFIALEHTNKNKMILAVKRAVSKPVDDIWRQIDDIKAFYGIRDQCLERLLKADLASPVSDVRTSPSLASSEPRRDAGSSLPTSS